MSSESMQTLADPVFRSKMPLFDGAMAPAGLSKPQNASGFLGKQTLQYNGACFAYDPRGRDGAVFTPPWSNSETSLLDSMSPVNHLSAMEGQKRTIHRQDSSSSEEGHSRPSSKRHTPLKQGFVLYTKSPEISSPSAAASVAVKRTGGQNSSSHSENSVYLAIPKPVYGRNPCCTELGCLMGHRYSLEHGSPRIPNTVYEHDWMQTRDAHYTERLPIQRKAQDALRQQRGLQFEPGADPLKRVAFSPGRARTLPGMLEPNYPSYPCTPTRSLFGSLSEHSQPLQTSPRGYPSLYPSHPTYEHMTSEVYQEHSPMSKYGQLAQHPVFYYPQANVEVENRTRCKDSGCKQREDVPVIHKHAISNPREHYIVPHSLLAEIPLPSGDMLPNHSFMQGFDYPYYAVPRFHLNASQIRAPLKRQHSLPSYHSSRLNVSPSRQHMSHPMTPAASQHKDKPNSSLRADQPHSSSPYLRVDHGSPSRRLSRPGVSPSGIQFSRFFSPPLTNLHTDPPVVPPAGLSMDRILDYSSREAQVTCPKQPKSIPVSPAAWPPQSPNRISDRIHAAAPNLRKILYSPAVATESKHGDSVSSFGSAVQKGSLKRTISHSSPPIKIKKEDMDLYEVEPTKKQQKLDTENAQVGIKNYSPPMPVIDNVFSLAPYQAYLQASGVLFPGRIPHRAIQSSEQHEVKRKTDAKEKRSDRGDQQPVVSLVSKEIAPPDKQTDETVVDVTERRNIKVEKVDPSDIDNSVETGVSQNDCIKVTLKKEIEEMVISDSEPTSLTKKCETDELESKPSVTDETETSEQTDRSISPSHLQTESKHSFRNIPAQSLKLSTYNIIIPVIRRCSSAAPPEEPPAQPMAELLPKQENQLPVRKHFIELHQSFCKLISKSVSASSEQELKKWLSQVKTTEPASSSAKVQKVSCLLGVKARETWLSEEIKSALHKVLERLREYTAQERCPFPHVMRAGAVFLPMLVVKELLFPMVQGSFIDQVLQEHKVELRPTTLSEEKILVQLHKRAFSSRLRRLMSLKHLPDIYVDVVNLLYYTCVCQHLESTSPDVQKRVQQKNLSAKLKQGTHDKLHDYLSLVGGWERTEPGCWWKNETLPREFVICDLLGLDMAPECKDGGHEASDSRDIAASAVSCSESHPQGLPKDQEAQLHFNANRTKSRVKSSSRRTFLDGSLSDEKEEEAGGVENTVVEGVLSTFIEKSRGSQEPQGAENGGADHLADCSLSPQSKISENSWTCPLMSDELSPSASDAEPEQPCGLQPDSQSPGPAKPQVRAKSCSGMILKLRRMFSEGLNRKKSRYQAVSESGTFADPSFSQADGGEGGNTEKDLHRRTPKVTHRWQRTGSFCHALRPLSSSSKRKSLLKIKYCPYLSACHSAEHRRRWVLRSAVQRARRAMRFYYPDLVGKTIHHLYEEDDKSEVWYRGEVLRIHEAHTNPLKTIFEVRYDSEPEWKYYLELLIDYKKGWLKIED